jgi:opacity protein-like surface antigen
MRLAFFLFTACVLTSASAIADSDGYQSRRTPVMQYGGYKPSDNAPVPTTQADPKDKRACCAGNGPPSWYIGVVGYVTFLKDVDIDRTAPFSDDTYTTDMGYGFGAQVGYLLTPDIRLELEIARRTNDLDKLNGQVPTLANGTYSAQKSTAYMANAYYDFHNSSNYTPYLGGGVGRAFIKAPVYYPGLQQFLKEWVLAYQFMAGVNYELETDINPIVFTFGYRYFSGQDPETKFNNAPITATYGNDSHNLELGGKFFF